MFSKVKLIEFLKLVLINISSIVFILESFIFSRIPSNLILSKMVEPLNILSMLAKLGA